MAIKKKLIHFNKKENFDTEVANGNILDTSIVFIKDVQQIYTHGTFYNGSTFDSSEIENKIDNIDKKVYVWNVDLNAESGTVTKEEYDAIVAADIISLSGVSICNMKLIVEDLVNLVLTTPETICMYRIDADLNWSMLQEHLLIRNGDGIAFLADDGKYKTLSTVATSGSYEDLSNKPSIPNEVTESTVSEWGFTKSTGTMSGVTMNGTTKSPDSNGIVNLGTVITSHQDISGKLDSSTAAATYATKSELSANLTSAKDYTDGVIETLVGTAPDTLDTIHELASVVSDNQEIIDNIESAITNKVDKVTGKGLSTNDYTTAEKNKLAGIATGATANTGTVTSVATGVGLTGGTISTSGTVKAKLRSETALTVDSAVATTTSGRVYPVAVDKTGYLAVNVPWTDTNTNTTYSAGNGLTLSGTIFNVGAGTGISVAADTVSTASDLYSTASATIAATAGWYRIATSVVNISNCSGIFQIHGIVSGYHTIATITAGTSYGRTSASNIGVLQCCHYQNAAFTKVRIVYRNDYVNGYAYLEVYNPNAVAISITVKMLSGTGWSLVTPSTAGSVPSGYTSKEVTLSNGTIYSEKFSGNGAALTNVNAASVDGYSVSKVSTMPSSPDANTIYFVV